MNKENLLSTQEITKLAEYKSTPPEFFKAFSAPWNSVKNQIVKLETRQVYDEKGNTSFEAWMDRNYELSIHLIPVERKVDLELYNDLMNRGVDFIRCRNIIFPLSSYLSWELECYRYNSRFGEKIFFIDQINFESIKSKAEHDFMVFDTKIAFIHDYDSQGKIQGGWIIRDIDHIQNLLMLFSLIKANSREWNMFINDNSH